MKKIMFVCTGNICRSPTAEAVFRHYIEQKGETELFDIQSSGTHGYHVGDPPDNRAKKIALERGILMQDLSADKFTKQDFLTYDFIIAMDQGHYNTLERMQPSKGGGHLSLFMDYVPNAEFQDVPDPYYGDIQGFYDVFDIIESGMENLYQRVSD